MMIFLVTLMLLMLCLLYRSTKKPKGFPPGPPRLPLVGFLPWLQLREPHVQLWKLSSKYGPVVGLFLGPHPVISVNGWEAVKESLLNDDLNGRPENIYVTLRGGGDATGLLFVEGDFWKEQRRFSLHHFRNLGFGKRSHESVIHEEVTHLIHDILNAPGSVTLTGMFVILSINILWAVMGGNRFDGHDPKMAELVERLGRIFRAGEASGGIVVAFPALRHVMPKSSSYNIIMDGISYLHQFIEKAVEEHRDQMDPDNPRDFIDIYLNEIDKTKADPDSSFTEKQLIAACVDVFSAGAETSASTLSFAILLITLYPDVAKAIQRELDSVLGQQMPSMEDRQRLVYTDATLMEVMRFRGVTPTTIPHSALKRTTLQGYRIPAKTPILNNLYSIHMDPEYWGDPENFRPERFINPDGTIRRDERVIAFGKGRRSCLGESLARMTVLLVFASLLQKFSFSLDPSVPVLDTKGKPGFTLGPPDYKVFAKARF